MEKKKVVILGGGTGQSTLLRGLKQYPLDITAVVSVCDDGKNDTMPVITTDGTDVYFAWQKVEDVITEEKPKKNPRMIPSFTPNTIDSINTGICRVVALIGPMGINPRGVLISTISIPINILNKTSRLILFDCNIILLYYRSYRCNVTNLIIDIFSIFFKQ